MCPKNIWGFWGDDQLGRKTTNNITALSCWGFQRKIHRETGIARKTIRKYIQKYEQAKNELLENSSGCYSHLAQDIVDKAPI